MQERPPSGSGGGKILFDIFEAEREVFQQSPLYRGGSSGARPMNRREDAARRNQAKDFEYQKWKPLAE